MASLPLFSLETWILLITFICLFVAYGSWTHGVHEKMGIPGPKPRMYLGSINRFNKVYYIDDKECAQMYGRVWGTYELRRPMLAVMEPDMLRSILVKECFNYFTNRRDLRLNGDLYDIVSIAEDDQWRRIRNIFTPNFTSGRIKEMFGIMKHHSRKLIDKLRPKVDNNEVVEVKSFFGPYGMDVMASCSMGVDMDSINNPSHPLLAHASNLFNISIPLFLLQGCFPFIIPLLKLLGVSLIQKSSSAFFRTVVEKVRAERNESSPQRDILQHLVNSKTVDDSREEKQKEGLNEHEIISQISILLMAGYETTASALMFLAYNMARNPEIMKRLQKEIDSTFPNKGSVQYEALMQMEYLDAVVNESLRLYPPIARIDRVAKETIKIKDITILKDMVVLVPVYALHHDPELWPEPEEFKPERFSKENKQSITPYTYLPFGVGPRNCLGMRFALVILKLGLVEVLQNYSFSICEETEIPLQMSPSGLLGPLRPIKLKLVTRSIASENVECN
ncbi:putative cytochrome P450 3A30-like isoform 2 [Scophthalmus maximus]|uniref:unspecific monooxygenase n=1 Tax=Scophthalmus maximus TaxID=52904 RepID=A0A2U9BMT0_SCOMX|nr:putative cytochrome P450 3A30-like isoform 2 [Scophthalmus maximus]